MDKFLTLLAEFVFRGIWEAAMFLFGTLMLANAEVKLKKFIFSSLGFALFALLVRQLPISYGIHTMFILVCLNMIVLLVFSINLEQSIKCTVIIACMLFSFEGLNGVVLQMAFGKDELKNILNSPFEKFVYFIPSMLMLGLFNLIVYKIKKRKRSQANAGTTEQSYS